MSSIIQGVAIRGVIVAYYVAAMVGVVWCFLVAESLRDCVSARVVGCDEVVRTCSSVSVHFILSEFISDILRWVAFFSPELVWSR